MGILCPPEHLQTPRTKGHGEGGGGGGGGVRIDLERQSYFSGYIPVYILSAGQMEEEPSFLS